MLKWMKDTANALKGLPLRREQISARRTEKIQKRKYQSHRDLLSSGSLPKCSLQLGLGQAKACSHELQPCLTHGGRRPGPPCHHLLHFKCISRKLDWKHSRQDSNRDPTLMWNVLNLLHCKALSQRNISTSSSLFRFFSTNLYAHSA